MFNKLKMNMENSSESQRGKVFALKLRIDSGFSFLAIASLKTLKVGLMIVGFSHKVSIAFFIDRIFLTVRLTHDESVDRRKFLFYLYIFAKDCFSSFQIHW